MEKDYLLLINKYAFNHPNAVIMREDLHGMLEENGITVDQRMKDLVEITIGEFFLTHHTFAKGHGLCAKPEAYFRYLEYLELVEARKSSRQAMIMAIVAIVISAILAAVQILIALAQ